MLSVTELKQLMEDTESDRVERTTSTSNTDKFCEAICAFANDFPQNRQPGYLIIGAEDSGKLSGLTVTDQLLQNLAANRSNGNIQPMPAMTVQKYTLPEGDVAVVEVLPSDLTPIRYWGRVWIRVGPTRRVANEQEERILSERRTAVMRTFDARPCHGCGLDQLVMDLFLVTYRPAAIAKEVLEENNRKVQEQLASLRFFDLARNCATNAGILMFGKDPLHWIPGATVQFVRFNGPRITDTPIEDKRFSGDMLNVLRELDSFISLQINSQLEEVSALRERMMQDYPVVALRELLMNSVMHRSYESNAPIRFHWFSDRIEIQNPGGLYGMVRPDNFLHQTDYRNPVIAEAMRALGYVNTYGRGIPRAQEALEKNGNPPAEFKYDEPMYFLATIRGKS